MSEASRDGATSPMVSNSATTTAPTSAGSVVVTTPHVPVTNSSNQNNVIVVSTSGSGATTMVPMPAASMVSAAVQMAGTPVQMQTSNAPQAVVSTAGALRPQQITTPMQVLQNPQYLQQYTLQQQLMLQNAAVQAAMVSQQQINLSAMQHQQQQQQQQQNRSGTAAKSPAIHPTGGVVIKSSNSSPITVNQNPLMTTTVKGTGTIMSQAASQVAGKSIMQRQNSQPLVIGQLVPVTMANHSKSTTMTTQAQMLANTAQLRLTSQQTLVTNTGQIINTGPTMITNPAIMNQLQFPHLMSQETLRALSMQQSQLGQQSMLTSQQAATLLSNQPLYIRAATPLHQHQQSLVGNMQNVVPTTTNANVSTANMQIKASLMGQQTLAGSMTKGTQHVLPSVTRVVNQAGTPLVTAQVQPTNLTLAVNPGRGALPQQKQVNRVKGKSLSKPSSPVPLNMGQARLVQTKSNSQELPTVMVQPKVQQQQQQQPQQQQQQHHQQQQQPQQQQHHQNYIHIRQHQPQSQQHQTSQQQLNQQQLLNHLQQQQQQLQQQQQQQQQLQQTAQEQQKESSKPVAGSKVEKTPTPPPPPCEVVPVVSAPKAADKPTVVTVSHNGVNGKAVNGAPEQNGSEESPMETDAPDDGNKDNGNPAPATGEKQKAIVKPNVLTHIIGGFVIEEGPEPFPVQRSSLLTEFIPPRNQVILNDSDSCDNSKENSGSESKSKEKPRKKGPIVVESDDFTLPSWDLLEDFDEYDDKPRLKCEFCGKIDYAIKFKGSKRFCSMACAKRYNVGCSKRMGLFKGRENGGKHQKKKKIGGSHRSWSRESGGRVTTGPIQRVNVSPGVVLTDSASSAVSETDTDTQSSGAPSQADPEPPTPELPPASNSLADHQVVPVMIEVKDEVPVGAAPAVPNRASEGSSATTASTASDATSGEDEQNSTLSPHESSPPRSPPVLEREGDLDPTDEPPRKRLAQQWSISTDSGSEQMSPAHLGSAQVDDDVRSTPEPRKPISKWSVQDVYEFIQSLTGCAAHANDFRSQEIDGQALLLLKEDHLMTAMSMKLGPALKICARINILKDEMS